MIQKHPDMYCFDDEFIFIIGHFMNKKAENLVLLCLFLFSRVNRFFTSQTLFLFRCTCGRDCAVNGGRVICSGDGYSSS